jgi:lipid-A-disaccharide synthase
MRHAGAQLLADFSGISHIGPVAAAASLIEYWHTFRAILREAQRRKPSHAILLDFPDFNLPLAKRLKRMGIRVLYYISPQVWAWRKGRVKSIARWIDRMFVIFPFEVDFYRRYGVNVEFVGHPLLDLDSVGRQTGEIRRLLGVQSECALVTLFPGSRQKEIAYILPILLEATCRLAPRYPCHFAIVKAQGIDPGYLRKVWDRTATAHPQLADGSIKLDLLDRSPSEALAESDVAIVKSGTATLHAALAQVPFVMVYKISPISWWVGQILISTPFYCIVNLIAGKPIVPELMQSDAKPERIAAETLLLLEDSDRRQQMKQEFQNVRKCLGFGRASDNLAAIIAAELGLPSPPGVVLPLDWASRYVH